MKKTLKKAPLIWLAALLLMFTPVAFDFSSGTFSVSTVYAHGGGGNGGGGNGGGGNGGGNNGGGHDGSGNNGSGNDGGKRMVVDTRRWKQWW